jgi:hypothetical protein
MAEGEELCSNPANWQRGAGVSVGRHCLEVTRRWHESSRAGGDFCFKRMCLATSEICYTKLISIVDKLT